MVTSIILQKRERGEADELVHFVTSEFGWLRGVAKNSRKSRIRFGGHLEPLALTDLQLRARKRDSLVWIEDAQLTRGFLRIRADVRLCAAAVHLFEVASRFEGEGGGVEG
jgi:DNA repair protein RecO (recombination protein O)